MHLANTCASPAAAVSQYIQRGLPNLPQRRGRDYLSPNADINERFFCQSKSMVNLISLPAEMIKMTSTAGSINTIISKPDIRKMITLPVEIKVIKK